MINYVTTRTPLRISFVGGGTDFPKYYRYKDGQVVSAAIKKYVYVTAKKHGSLYKEKFRLNYSISESGQNINEIKNEITKACLKQLNIKFPVYISTVSDIPTSSGLGSSSAFTVGLLLALHTLRGEKISKYKLAEEACKIELERLRKPIGRQDQYAVTFGSINNLIFKKNNKVIVKNIKITKKNLINLSNQMYLIWTGQIRNSYKILKSQNKNLKYKIMQLNQMKNLVPEFAKNFRSKKIDTTKLAKLINLNWNLKRMLSKDIFNKKLESIHSNLSKSKAEGIKLLGAGGGCFFLALVKKKNKIFFEKKMKKLKIFSFEFDMNGTKIIYKNEKN